VSLELGITLNLLLDLALLGGLAYALAGPRKLLPHRSSAPSGR